MVLRNGRNGFEKLYNYEGKYYLLSGIGTNGYGTTNELCV